MKAWLYVGARVVCVDAAPHMWGPALLERGKTYTVAAIDERAPITIAVDGLAGIPADVPDATGDGLWHWDANRFRPLVDTSKQIEALRKLVEPSNLPAKVDA